MVHIVNAEHAEQPLRVLADVSALLLLLHQPHLLLFPPPPGLRQGQLEHLLQPQPYRPAGLLVFVILVRRLAGLPLLQRLERVVGRHQLPGLWERVVDANRSSQRGPLLCWSQGQRLVLQGPGQVGALRVLLGPDLVQAGQALGTLLGRRGADGIGQPTVVQAALWGRIAVLRGLRELHVVVVAAAVVVIVAGGDVRRVAALLGALQAVVILLGHVPTRGI